MLLRSDARSIPLDDGTVQCVVTSPPYWGLRDYGLGDSGIGLEPTPEEYVANIVQVFREVWRVLRDDGTLWLNLGDSYSGSGGENGNGGIGGDTAEKHGLYRNNPRKRTGLKPKDLVGIPWRVAFALQADGWYLRSDIIWAKPNPMPESVTDRPTKSHEYLFLLAKGQGKSRVVEFSRLPSEVVHFSKDLGTQAGVPGIVPRLCVDLATAIFDRAQHQEEFGLPPFYAEVWKKRPDGSDGDFVRGLPVEHRAAVWAARLLDADATTKEFLSELYRLGVTLSDGDNLLIGGGVTKLPLPPGVFRHGDASVRVHDAGQVCECDFLHAKIVLRSSGPCNYYYDAEAIKEQSVGTWNSAEDWAGREALTAPELEKGADRVLQRTRGFGTHHPDEDKTGRNRRTVWTIPTQPYRGAHFATFPERLVEPCILAGTSPKCCGACGAPWERVTEITRTFESGSGRSGNMPAGKNGPALQGGGDTLDVRRGPVVHSETIGWRPPCNHDDDDDTGSCLVLDCFAGTGTVGVVAQKHGRRFVGVDMQPKYLELARERIASAPIGMGL